MLKVRHAWGYAGLTPFPSLHHILEELNDYDSDDEHHHEPDGTYVTIPTNLLLPCISTLCELSLSCGTNMLNPFLTWLQKQHSAPALEMLRLLTPSGGEPDRKRGLLLLPRIFESLFQRKLPNLITLDIQHGQQLDD